MINRKYYNLFNNIGSDNFNIFKKFILGGLLLASSILLISCGKNESDEVTDVELQDVDVSTVFSSADIAVSYSNAYESTSYEINTSDTVYSTYLMKNINNQINIVSSVYSNEGGNQILLSKKKTDATDFANVYLETPDTNDFVTDELTALVERTNEYYNSDSYQYTTIDADYSVTKSYYGINMDDSGNIYGILKYSFYFYSDVYYESISYNDIFFCKWNNSGTLVSNVLIDELGETNSNYKKAFILDGKYNAIFDTDGFLTCYSIGNNGGFETKEIANDSLILNAQDIIVNKNSETVVIYKDEAGINRAYKLSSNLSIASELNMPDFMALNSYISIDTGFDYDYVFSTSIGLYGYNEGSSDINEIMNYVNSDFNGYYINKICFVDASSFYAIYSEFDSYRDIISSFNSKPIDENDNKAVVILGAYKLTADTRKQVLKFNQENGVYKIVVNEYSYDDTIEEPDKGAKNLEKDMLSGASLDLVMTDIGKINVYKLANAGVLTPWNYLVNSDSDFSGSQIMTNAMDAYAINGLDYILVYDYTFNTYLGSDDILSDDGSLSIEDATKVLKKSQSDYAALYLYATQENYLSNLIKYDAYDYIDFNEGTTSFNSNGFIKLLEYGKTLPTDIEMLDNEYGFLRDAYRNGDILLQFESVSRVDDFWNDAYTYFDGKCALFGYPNSADSYGAAIEYSSTPILILSNGNLSGAWTFAKTFFSFDYQFTVNGNAIPVAENVFEAWKKGYENNIIYYTDAYGATSVVEETYYYDGSEHTIPTMNEDNAQAIADVIVGTSRVAFYDDAIEEIITEEVNSYFEGGQSAKKAAENIDNKIRVYLFY